MAEIVSKPKQKFNPVVNPHRHFVCGLCRPRSATIARATSVNTLGSFFFFFSFFCFFLRIQGVNPQCHIRPGVGTFYAFPCLCRSFCFSCSFDLIIIGQMLLLPFPLFCHFFLTGPYTSLKCIFMYIIFQC